MDPSSDPNIIRPRKRVSQACLPCSRRKTKCDGELPICGQCLSRGVNDCNYAVSKRNKRERRSTPGFQDSGSIGSDSSPSFSGVRTPAFDQSMQSSNGAPSPIFQTHPNPNNIRPYAPQPINARPARTLTHRTAPTALPAVPRDVSARLFKAYFDTIHPMWPILYKPSYDMQHHQDILDSTPQPLLYAIYSIAACVQPGDDRVKERATDIPTPAILYQAAILAFGNDHLSNGAHPLGFLKASIETCQALVILALQQHGLAESESASLLCSLASGMAIELRLHRAVGAQTSPTEVQVRSRLWWNVFVLDKMMACETGRPVLLRIEETDTPYPSTNESDEFQLLSLKNSGPYGPVAVKTHTISGFHTSIEITTIMEKVSREVYSVGARVAASHNIDGAEQIRSRLSQDLKNYHAKLDNSPLKLDLTSAAPAPPVTITNMVWMYCTTILLHRPFIIYQLRQNKPPNELIEICSNAARSICEILERYAANLPVLSCDMIFPIFTTASTLHYTMPDGDANFETHNAQDRVRIDLCVRWLLVLSKSWKNASALQARLPHGNITKVQNFNRPLSADNKMSSAGPQSFNAVNRPVEDGSAWNQPSSFSPQPTSDFEITAEDWAFLENLGDSTDEFYAMDAAFKERLRKGNDVDRMV